MKTKKDKIKVGDTIVIIDVHIQDACYNRKDGYIGQKRVITELFLGKNVPKGYIGCHTKVPDHSTHSCNIFYAVKVKKLEY